jgi:hypothetical protein
VERFRFLPTLTLLLGLLACRPVFAQDSLNIHFVTSKYSFWDGIRTPLLQDDNLYLTTDSTGVAVLDISNPDQPIPVSRISTEDRTLDICLSGIILCAAEKDQGAKLVDISNPALPQTLATIPEPAYACEIQNDRLWIVNTDLVLVYDISTPSNPNLVAELPSESTYDYQYGLMFVGNYAYLGTYWGDLLVYDATEPDTVTHAGSIEVGRYNTGFASGQDRLYTGYHNSSGMSGIHVYDLSDPVNPTLDFYVRRK